MAYAYNPDPNKSARATGRALRVSTQAATEVCREVSGMRLEKAKALLQDVLDQRRSIQGRFYTNATRQVLNIVRSAESNAEGRGLDPEGLHVHASAHKGFTFYRPRGWKRRRERRKVTNLQIVLEAR